jgi:hypothetical protein
LSKFNITLSTGTVLTPNAGYVGINDELRVCEGYDNDIHPQLRQDWMDDEDGPFLTPTEQIELGLLMIERWQRFIDRANAGVTAPVQASDETKP